MHFPWVWVGALSFCQWTFLLSGQDAKLISAMRHFCGAKTMGSPVGIDYYWPAYTHFRGPD